MGFYLVDSGWVETDDSDRRRALEGIDALAWRLVGRAAPVRFGPAESADDDERTLHCVAWDGGEIVASCRFVVPAYDRYLPTEEAFDLILEPRGLMADISVVQVAESIETAMPSVVLGLLGWVWLESRLLDFTDICCALTPYEVNLCERHGLEVVVLGESRSIGGEERFPAIVRPLETILIPYAEEW
jgi:hypothetical protein